MTPHIARQLASDLLTAGFAVEHVALERREAGVADEHLWHLIATMQTLVALSREMMDAAEGRSTDHLAKFIAQRRKSRKA